jgi:hypothetical protein
MRRVALEPRNQVFRDSERRRATPLIGTISAETERVRVLVPVGMLGGGPHHVRVFLIPLLRAIKVSLPRPVVQGSVGDRDMHAGQQYVPLLSLPVPDREQL